MKDKISQSFVYVNKSLSNQIFLKDHLKKRALLLVIMLRRTAVDMEQSENLLDMNDGETVRYLYNSKCKKSLLCASLLITHLIMTGLGVFSGLYLCQDGHVDCSYDDGSL